MSARTPLSPLGRLFAATAWFEAFTWAGLLVGMLLKHVTGTTDLGVWFFGRLHGGAFVAYGVVALLIAVRYRWGWFPTLVALAAAVPPLTTIPAELWLRRRGLLTRPAERPASGAGRDAEPAPTVAARVP